MSEQASSLYNSVNSAVEPYAYRLGKTLQDDVAPTVKDAVKTSLNAVFTGVPSVISQVRVRAADTFGQFFHDVNSFMICTVVAVESRGA